MGLVGFVNRVATGPRRVRARFTLPGVIFFFSMLTVLALGARYVDRWFGWGAFMRPILRIALGSPLTVLGGGLTAWCIVRFRRAHGTPVPLNPPQELVFDGLYERVRNPMMTGVFVFMLGLALLMGSRALLFLGLPLLICAGVFFVKVIEEPELERRFGQAYVAYRNRVPMFLPKLGKGARQARSGQTDSSPR